MTIEAATTPPATEAKILHISDLHFGGSFNYDSWTDLINHARTLSPDLLIVTGDLVDNPTRWSLTRAENALRDVARELECEVIVVPGNHDTRLWGLVPIRWINPLIIVSLVLFLIVSIFSFWGYVSTSLWLVSAFLVAIIVASKSVFLDFNKKFKEFIPEQCCKAFPKLGLEIFAFDSATKSLFGARGRIPKEQFVRAHGDLLKSSKTVNGSNGEGAFPYRLAILHHHPLPIPYDDTGEALMITDNAGALLAEASKLGIRLILHGHKHHSHFSRVTINAGEKEEHELAVLAVGTLSRSGKMDPPEHHFYFLRLDRFHNMEVTRYVAKKGGAFEKQSTSPIEPATLVGKRFYEAALRKKGVKCDSNVLTAELTPDGDMHYRYEYHGFQVTGRNSFSTSPGKVDVEASTGHIDGFGAGDLDPGSRERIKMELETAELTHRVGRISFGRKITSEDSPLDFYFDYVSLNAFAMSVQQHEQMYSEPFRTEHVMMSQSEIPTEIFDFIVKFPEGFKIAGKPQLLIEKRDGERDPVLEEKLRRKLKYYPHLNVITSRIVYPRPDLSYKIQWTLTDEPPPSGNPTESMMGDTEKLARRLLKTTPTDPEFQQLNILMTTLEKKVKKDFSLQGDDPLEVSLMVYDKSDRALRIVAANFALNQELRDFKLKFGNGIAGRAYKMNKGRMFVTKSAIEKKTPNFFYPLNGKPCKLVDIEERVIISLPLRHPGDEALIYGVLNLSSKNVGSRLQDVKERRVLNEFSEFQAGMNDACYKALEERIFGPTGRGLTP